MSTCPSYDPDKVFQRFKVVEFPPSFVGLSTTRLLDVEIDLNKSAYLKTMCEGRLMKFEDARELSGNHRAYNLELNDERTVKVTFMPNNDCIAKAKHQTQLGSHVFELYITDVEPSIPVSFEETSKPKFFIRRLNLIEKEITLNGTPKEQAQDSGDHKLYLQMTCLSVQVGNTWIWFTSDVGQFFIRVTTQPRWDIPIDSLQAKVQTWPMDPCSCGEACECYRTTILMIPHRVDLMLRAMRHALLEHASSTMIQIFDQLIDTETGKIILTMLLEEGGTNMSDVNHILRSSNTYRITSRALMPRIERVTLQHHTNAILALPVTLPASDKFEKYSISFTSECGADIRTYRIFFIESTGNVSE
ncbi:unnamed protein product [Spodoptera exigua]|nr:unnamed protein product [Spodoptera exigua]